MKGRNLIIVLAVVVMCLSLVMKPIGVSASASADIPRAVTGSSIGVVLNTENEYSANEGVRVPIESVPEGTVSGSAVEITDIIETEEDFVLGEDAGLSIDTSIDVSIEPTIVDVSIPMNISVYINPNKPDGFMYSTIKVDNNTTAPVELSVKSSVSYNAPFDNFIAPNQLPEYLDWDNMTLRETMQYFAIGFKPMDKEGAQWRTKNLLEYAYVCDNEEKISLGTIYAEDSVYLGMKSYYGKSFKEAVNFQINVVFVAELIQ